MILKLNFYKSKIFITIQCLKFGFYKVPKVLRVPKVNV